MHVTSLKSRYGVFLLNVLYEHPQFDLFDTMVHVWLETDKMSTDYFNRTDLLSYDELREKCLSGEWNVGEAIHKDFTSSLNSAMGVPFWQNHPNYEMRKQLTKEIYVSDFSLANFFKVINQQYDVFALFGLYFLANAMEMIETMGGNIVYANKGKFDRVSKYIMGVYRSTPGLENIRMYYKDERATRSRVLKMNHIEEGLAMLDLLKASPEIKEAWCIHPIVQNGEAVEGVHKATVELAQEYAAYANAYLCTEENDWVQTPVEVDQLFASKGLGRMSESCATLLLVDKVQNRKDFRRYHMHTHPRSAKLKLYFNLWIEYINDRYQLVNYGDF